MDFDEWLLHRLGYFVEQLEERERSIEAVRRLARDRAVGEQYGFRGQLQWYVTAAGVGHGLREGTRALDASPEFDLLTPYRGSG